MVFSFRKLGKRFFILINVVLCLIFLLSCLQPWLNPERFWFLGFLSLAFPYLMVLVAAFILFWLIAKWKFMLISIVTLLLAYQQIGVLFSLKKSAFEIEKKENNLRVMTWNVKGFQGITADNELKKGNAAHIIALIDKLKPDVVCFQEFGQYDSPIVKRNYVKDMQNIGFKYNVQSRDYNRGGIWGYSSGLAIFSRSPFVRTKRMQFTSSIESVLYADFVLGNDTVRVFTTHLQSFKFMENDYRDIEKIKNNDDSLVEASYNIFTKMKRAFRNRGAQADMIRPLLDSCPYPEIITCDMNDVPSSYSYWQLRSKRKDAFLEKGRGIGRTFLSIAPTLRIDYVLFDDRFSIHQFKIGTQPYSDHLPLIADFELKPKAR